MSNSRYPQYKDSGIEWLDTIPEHWKIAPLKALADVALSGVDKVSQPHEAVVRFLGTNIVYNRSLITDNIDLEIVTASEAEIGRFGLLLDDVVITKDSVVRTNIAIPAYICEPLKNVICGYHLALVRSRMTELYGKFLFWQLNSPHLNEYFIAAATGTTIIGIGKETISSAQIVAPPLAEQRAIAAFLDRETARIDTLIAKQEQMIALLQEKRKAIISHAVTRGLNPDVPLKHSGVEWLGMVPEHWDTAALKHLVVIPITDGPHETPEFIDEGVPFLSAEAVKNGKLDFERKRGYIAYDLHAAYSKKCQPIRDDVFMVKSGNTTGSVAIVETDEVFSIWSPLALIRCNQTKILPRYTYYFMGSQFFQMNVILSSSYGTQPNIGMGVIENLSVAYPATIEEQQHIVEYIDCETAKIDALIGKAQTAINLLKEHHTSLISAAVTGKIDVRGL